MSLAYPQSTLAHYGHRPLAVHVDGSATSCKTIAAKTKSYLSANTTVVPEEHAIAFYFMNHVAAELKQRVHPHRPLTAKQEHFMQLYDENVAAMALRAFHYLLLICTREARHLSNKSAMMPLVSKEFGKACAAYHEASHTGSSSAASKFTSNPPGATIGAYTKSLQFLFYKGQWSPSFGGKKWGMVTDCLVRFVDGTYTAEMMLDTVWTLSHNNGPIFNKGMLYSMYAGSAVQRILDLQRAGFIPTAVVHDKKLQEYVNPLVQKLVTMLPELGVADIVKEEVDWELVQKLGAVGHYVSAKPKAAPAPSVSTKPFPAAGKPKFSAPENQMGVFEIMPDVFVPIVKKVRT